VSEPVFLAVKVSALRAGYGRKEVLHGIDLSVDVSQTYGLIGLNGAGKTTWLKQFWD